MNLREAYRYHNHIENLHSMARAYLLQPANFMHIEEHHMRSKANPDAQDETVVASQNADKTLSNVPVETLVHFIIEVLDEELKLSEAIEKAKSSMGDCYDAILCCNKKRRSTADLIESLGRAKDTERTREARSYKINAEGNQVAYYYDVIEKSSVTYDRNEMKRISRSMRQLADQVSSKIDRADIDTEVEMTPVFDINDSFEDAVLSFAERYSYDKKAV